MATRGVWNPDSAQRSHLRGRQVDFPPPVWAGGPWAHAGETLVLGTPPLHPARAGR